MSRKRRGIKAWYFLRERYINLRVRGSHISLAEFAEQEEISPRTLERRAYKDGWLAEVERRLEQQHLAVIEHSSTVTAELRRRLESDLESIDKLVPDVEN